MAGYRLMFLFVPLHEAGAGGLHRAPSDLKVVLTRSPTVTGTASFELECF